MRGGHQQQQQQNRSNNNNTQKANNSQGNRHAGQQRPREISAKLADPRVAALDWESIYDSRLHNKKCHRCWQFGHYQDACLLIPLGLWFCGGCNRMTDHISTNCRKPRSEFLDNINRNKNNYSGANKGNKSGGGGGGKMSKKWKGKQKKEKPYDRNPSANVANEVKFQNNNIDKNITFVADSGASEHITGKGLFLSNFKRCLKGVIKSAKTRIRMLILK